MAISELLKKTVLVGIGAAAEVADRSKDLTDSLAKKGQDTINKGRAMNEELKRKAREDLLEREFDSCLQFFTNQIAQNVDYINAFEFFYCQICENNCTNMG